MIGLTSRQRAALAHLTINPDASFQEIATALGARHRSSASRLLDGLEERGYIRRLRNRDRAIQVIRPLPILIKGKRYRFIPVGGA